MPTRKIIVGLLFSCFIIYFNASVFAQKQRSLQVPPIANNDSVLLGKNQVIQIDVLANDIDPDGNINNANVQVTTTPQLGLFLIVGNKIQYTPGTNVCGFDSIKYRVTDENTELSNIATIYLEITCFNLAPVANNDILNLDEDILDSVDVFDNDRFTDGPDLNFSILTQPKNGTASISNLGFLKYQGDLNFDGLDTIQYLLCDGDLTDPLCDTAYVFISINPINDPPIAINDTLQIFQSQNKNINLSFNDFSIDGPQLNYNIIQNPTRGTASLQTNGVCNYSIGNNYIGRDSLQYEVCDLAIISLCDTAWLYIEIKPVFDKIQTNNDTLRIPRNSNNAINILLNDIFPNTFNIDSIFFSQIPNVGNFTYADSIINYIPPLNYTGVLNLEYYIKDDIDSISNTSTITIIVNELPSSANICPIQSISNQSVNINLFQFSTEGTVDINKNKIMISKYPNNGTLGTYNALTESINYNPELNFQGTDSFQYRIYDVDGFVSNNILVCIEMINEIPVKAVGVISPNADGINDYLTFELIDNYPNNEVIVFDRYWNEVFHTESYSSTNYWDALNVNTGTYFYLVKIRLNNNEKILKGYVSLIK